MPTDAVAKRPPITRGIIFRRGGERKFKNIRFRICKRFEEVLMKGQPFLLEILFQERLKDVILRQLKAASCFGSSRAVLCKHICCRKVALSRR